MTDTALPPAPAGIPLYDASIPAALIPPYSPMRDLLRHPDQRRAAEEATARRIAAATAAYDTALADWRAVHDQHADSPALAAVLDLHRPALDHQGATCATCVQHDGYEDVEPGDWPCSTYNAVKVTRRAGS